MDDGGDELVLEDEDLQLLEDVEEDDEDADVLDPASLQQLPEAGRVAASVKVSRSATQCYIPTFSDSRSTTYYDSEPIILFFSLSLLLFFSFILFHVSFFGCFPVLT